MSTSVARIPLSLSVFEDRRSISPDDDLFG
jgi:hypothetical protein